MNTYQLNMWNQSMRLVDMLESFYYADRFLDGKWFRIFNYRLASYTDFMEPGGLELRGHTFEIDREGEDATPIRLASNYFPKFFNYRENPSTMDLDLTKVREIAHKMDGSLISTFTVNGFDDLRLKTKGSLDSEQCIDAMNWLNQDENYSFKRELIGAERLGYTVMMEWIAPNNRIVIGYEEPKLVVLGVRSYQDGSYVFFEDVDIDVFPEIIMRWTKIEQVSNSSEFLASVPDMTGIEGFVCRMEDGTLFKLKCSAYVALHHSKDSINSPRRLFEAVLEEASDDLRSLFYDDPLAIKMIEDMEAFVEVKYNHLVDTVERFYERNKHLERKDYAILGREELDSMFFGLAMNRYIGREFSYKTFLKGKWKELGLKEEVQNEED